MKGRPITREEFERMLGKIQKAIFADVDTAEQPKPDAAAHQAAVVASWHFYLEGLWASGLRLAESLEVCWDRDDKLCVDLGGKRPVLRILAELEKGHRDRMLPISPEFAEFLLRTPAAERTGYVFKPLARRVKGPRLTEHRVGEIVSTIGRAAGVKVNTDPKTGKVKFASAHDLRRSFGERWASRVMPQVLMELMRHESIETTMKFYVGRNAQATADVLWQAHERQQAAASNTSGNNGPKTAEFQGADSVSNSLPRF
jgi:integrase